MLHPIHSGTSPLDHVTTQSSLDDYRIPPQLQDHSKPSEYHDLLDYFKQRQSDNYRYIKFIVPDDNPTTANFTKRVSFDTVNLETDEDHLVEWDDAFGWDLVRLREASTSSNDRGRKRESVSASNGGTSPLASPTRGYSASDYFTANYSFGTSGTSSTVGGLLSPNPIMPTPAELENLLDTSLLQTAPKAPTYPTTPIIVHRGCTLTKKHKDFDKLYDGLLKPKAPVLPKRSILIYVSGRRHTWVALDWILTNFLENGDSIVICCAINYPDILTHKKRKNSFYSPHGFLPPTNPRSRFLHRNKPENVPSICENLMEYVEAMVSPKKIIKITIEFVVGDTKNVLKEMYKLYEPNLVCTATKPNIRISAPLRSWNSSKLTDRLVKNFPLPVIVVPAANMNNYEYKLEDRFKKQLERSKNAKMDGVNASFNEDGQSSQLTTDTSVDDKNSQDDDEDVECTKDKLLPNDEDLEDDDEIDSIEQFDGDDNNSITSENSDSSTSSYSSFEEISRLYYDYKKDLALGSKRDAVVFDAEALIHDIKLISDKSSELCNEIRTLAPDYRGNGSKLARAITGSNLFDVVPYKTKSMLDPVLPKTSSSGLSYREMKEMLKQNAKNAALKQQQSDPENESDFSPPPHAATLPVITIGNDDETSSRSSLSPSPQPITSTSLKWDIDHASPTTNNKKKSKVSTKLLQKSLSHDIGNDVGRITIEPLKSHPDLKSLAASDSNLPLRKESSIKKKSKKKFWKFFN
ncbi:uncharacterized protein RJT21DRAFT_131787 [Scheffersomyces amazonensis]|uniref:uncharacterized protein n=1 Tax=Scheffersomyces amazonensis TaxID=1078765 RepID=UPI00315DC149